MALTGAMAVLLAGLEEARWTDAPAVPWPGGGVSAQLVDVRGTESLRLDCDGARRLLLIDGALVERTEQAEQAEDGWWYWPLTDPRAVQQVIVGEDCTVQYRDASPSAAGFDRLEHSVDVAGLRDAIGQSDVFSSAQHDWLSAAVDEQQWLARYEGIRPGRVHQAPGLWWLKPDVGSPVQHEDERWWQADDVVYTVNGPGRLFVEVLPAAVNRPTCVQVDADTQCQLARTDRRLFVDDGLVFGAQASPVIWRVLLGEGSHEVRLPSAQRVRVSRTPVVSTDSKADAALQSVSIPTMIIGPCGDQDCPSPIRRSPIHTSEDIQFLRVPSVAWPPTEPSWMSLDDLRGEEDLLWRDASSRMGLWFSTLGERCTVQLGDRTLSSIPERSDAWFYLQDLPDDAFPTSDCDVDLRLMMPLPESLFGRPRHIIARMTPLDAMEDVVLPEGLDNVQLKLSWPQGSQEMVSVSVEQPDKITEMRIRPAELQDNGVTAEGVPWSLPITVNLGDDVRRVVFDAPGNILGQITAPALFADREDVAETGEDVVERTPDELLQQLQAMSAADAIDHQARADVLLELGAWGDALLERQHIMTPSPISIDALLLNGVDRDWLSLSGTWLQGQPDVSALYAAADGDFLTVVSDPTVQSEDRLLSWRRAILGGQILNADQRIQAYIDLVNALPPERRGLPVWGSIRALSRWETVRYVQDAAMAQWESFPLLEEAQWEQRLSDALFPTRWPVGESIDLDRERLVQLPPGPAMALPVRCRPRGRGGGSRTMVSVLDGSGATVNQKLVSMHAAEDVLLVPAGTRRLIRMEQPLDAVCQVKLAAETAAKLQDREGWRYQIQPDHPARVAVLAPTVLRVDAQPGSTLLAGQGDTHFEGAVPEGGSVEIPITATGPVEVMVSSTQTQWIRVAMRQPRQASVAPLTDRNTTRVPMDSTMWRVMEPSLVSQGVTRASLQRPVTYTAGVAVDGEPGMDDLQLTPPRLSVQAGAMSRPWSERLWFGGEVVALTAAEQPMGLTRLYGEWVPVRGPWRLGLRTSGQLAQGAPNGQSMTTLKGRGTLMVGRWMGDRIRLAAFMSGTGRADLSAEGRFEYGIHPELWSSWQQDHLTSSQHTLQLRGSLNRWLWLGTQGSVLLNPIGDGVDRVGATAWAELSRPGAWMWLGGGVVEWQADNAREFARREPFVKASGWGFWWPSGDLAVQMRGSVTWWPSQGGFSVLAGPTVYFSADRGLMDLPYSSLFARSAAEWGHDMRAIEEAQ